METWCKLKKVKCKFSDAQITNHWRWKEKTPKWEKKNRTKPHEFNLSYSLKLPFWEHLDTFNVIETLKLGPNHTHESYSTCSQQTEIANNINNWNANFVAVDCLRSVRGMIFFSISSKPSFLAIWREFALVALTGSTKDQCLFCGFDWLRWSRVAYKWIQTYLKQSTGSTMMRKQLLLISQATDDRIHDGYHDSTIQLIQVEIFEPKLYNLKIKEEKTGNLQYDFKVELVNEERKSPSVQNTTARKANEEWIERVRQKLLFTCQKERWKKNIGKAFPVC